MTRSIGLVFVICLLAFTSASTLLAQSPEAGLILRGETPDHIWSMDVVEGRGLLIGQNQEITIELFNRSTGISGYDTNLEFLGRTDSNFYYLQVFVNYEGPSFWVYFFDYKTGRPEWKLFEGEYRVAPTPTQLTEVNAYRPHGKIPNYMGPAFQVRSSATELQPSGGSAQYQAKTLSLFPIAHVRVTESWHEFWTLGVDTQTGGTYLLLYYTIAETTIVIDLSTGQVDRPALGIGDITGGKVNIDHNTIL